MNDYKFFLVCVGSVIGEWVGPVIPQMGWAIHHNGQRYRVFGVEAFDDRIELEVMPCRLVEPLPEPPREKTLFDEEAD